MEPINTEKLGGVAYNSNQFKGEALKNGKFKLTAKETGETLIFGQQPKGVPQDDGVKGLNDYYENGVRMRPLNSKIELSVGEGRMYDDNHFYLKDIMGATFSSSKDAVSYVDLQDCQDTKVDLAANNSKLYGDYANVESGKGNEVILDGKDSADINMFSVKGKGIADQKDYQ